MKHMKPRFTKVKTPKAKRVRPATGPIVLPFTASGPAQTAVVGGAK